jgi:hypothetical protein
MWHGVPFQQLDPPLPAQLAQDGADLAPQLPVEDFAPVLG